MHCAAFSAAHLREDAAAIQTGHGLAFCGQCDYKKESDSSAFLAKLVPARTAQDSEDLAMV
jgi:hypothetical protein